MHLDSLLNLGLAVVCGTCESEIDVDDEQAERGVCRPCGVAFLIDSEPLTSRRSRPISA